MVTGSLIMQSLTGCVSPRISICLKKSGAITKGIACRLLLRNSKERVTGGKCGLPIGRPLRMLQSSRCGLSDWLMLGEVTGLNGFSGSNKLSPRCKLLGFMTMWTYAKSTWMEFGFSLINISRVFLKCRRLLHRLRGWK